jgi:hypothetical protein
MGLIYALMRRQLNALFLVNVYNGFKFCPLLLETFGIRVAIRNFRDISLFTLAQSV